MNRDEYTCERFYDPAIYGAKIKAVAYEMKLFNYMDDGLIVSLKL